MIKDFSRAPSGQVHRKRPKCYTAHRTHLTALTSRTPIPPLQSPQPLHPKRLTRTRIPTPSPLTHLAMQPRQRIRRRLRPLPNIQIRISCQLRNLGLEPNLP